MKTFSCITHISLGLISLLCASIPTASASGSYEHAGVRLRKTAEAFNASCGGNFYSSTYCKNGRQVRLLYVSGSRSRFLTSPAGRMLTRNADLLANIWGDTILEGDYVTQGPVVSDYVSGLYENGQLKAYWIRYSQQAWMTADCEWDEKRPSRDCVPGRIAESAFISPDFRNQEIDQYAEFFD